MPRQLWQGALLCYPGLPHRGAGPIAEPGARPIADLADTAEAETGPNAAQKVCAVLRALGSQAPAELRDLARAAGLNKVTTFRIAATLVREGFASRPANTQLYDLGPELFILQASLAKRIDLRQAARPALAMLAARSGDAAVLSIRSGAESVCIDRQTGTFPIQSNHLHPGTRRPLGVGAGATALLASLAEPEAEALLETLADKLADFPHLSVPLIRQQLRAARARGYALVTDLIVDRLGGIAAAIRSPSGDPVGAFSILGLTERIAGRVADLDALLKRAVQETERALDSPARTRKSTLVG